MSTKIKVIATIEIFTLMLSMSISAFAPLHAAIYTESTSDTFLAYKEKLEGALQDMQREFIVNNAVTEGTISNIRNLVNEAYIRLPDNGEFKSKNDGIKKNTDLYLDLASKFKTSQTHVSNAAANAGRFLSEAKIEQITGTIQANPASGNAPLTVSFLATGKDPSGVNLPDANYIWWTRERYGRNVIGTGPSLIYSFTKEGSYQVFLDIVSNSRNSKGKIDVLPTTLSQDIDVKPRLGNIVLLVNGVNASNMDQLKISPTLGKIGILFDATASRAISNGTIVKTEWDFGNGNTVTYDGSPNIERQFYVNEGTYKITITTTSNQGQSFSKKLTLIVRDPAAVISTEQDIVFVGENLSMTAKTYLSNTANVEYNWTVQDMDGEKKTVSAQKGSNFSYKFAKPGQYIVTLTSRSPNGNTDSDSRVISVESHPPTVNLDSPNPISPEKPNTIVFDASRSFDLDTKSRKGLLYTWAIDGEIVELSDITNDGAKGTYTFDTKGPHTVSLTVANSYGKVTTVEKNFEIRSTLAVGMNIAPRASQIGTTVTFQARSPRASFFEWNAGDGSPSTNGTSDTFQHTYKKTGVYTATLRVKNADGSEENGISRSVYVTDTDSPFALISLSNGTNTIIENVNGCEGNTGTTFTINRSENTLIDGGKSINIDGTSAGLTYTWKYFGRVKTGPSLSEKFTEIGCFPIDLTVRSEKNGAIHTSRAYLDIRNIAPKLTSVTNSIDPTKRDSQKVLVTTTANGARDEDGVIVSYVWYYTTESDSEKQNVRITQSPSTTFVLPNVTEKYYFGVIIEDNDGARIDSNESLSDKSPLLIGNDDANVNMPLISLSIDKTSALTDEVISFSASAKDILGRDITAKSEYYWDFDGDGQIDKKTTEPRVSYAYKNSGRYNMKLKMINNGSSNTKYQVIYVKNELKATAKGYRIGENIYFINTSAGTYDKAEWNVGGTSSENITSFMIPASSITSNSSLGTLTVKSGGSEVSSVNLSEDIIEMIVPNTDGSANIQTHPALSSGSIQIQSASEKIIMSAFGNTAKEYLIDTDTKIDSDLDGITDNDKDNKDSPSYSDGSPFVINNLGTSRVRNKEIKISLVNDAGLVMSSKVIPVTLAFIAGNNAELRDAQSGSGSESFSTIDKENLEKLQTKIRGLSPDDRIIFTQYYNRLIENWGDLHDRTQGLLDIQEAVVNSATLDATTKSDMSGYIDIILVGDAQATNEISVAGKVIEGLIKLDNPNRDYIIERLEKIKSHPGNLADNKLLGKEILQKVEGDNSLSNGDKLLLKSQLQIILSGGQENIPESERSLISEESNSRGGFISGVLGFMKGTAKIFFFVLGIIGVLVLLGYIFYRLTRKNEDTGFQDFLIDSVAHNKKSSPPKTAEAVVKAIEVKPEDTLVLSPTSMASPRTSSPAIASPSDPLSALTPKEVPMDTSLSEIQAKPNTGLDPISTEEKSVAPSDTPTEVHSIPDWLKPVTKSESPVVGPDVLVTPPDSMIAATPNPEIPEATMIEVKKPEEVKVEVPTIEEPKEDTPKIEDMVSAPIEEKESEVIPDWLKPAETPVDDSLSTEPNPVDPLMQSDEPANPPDTDLPDWLKASLEAGETETKKPKKNTTSKKNKERKVIQDKEKPAVDTPKKTTESSSDIPDWLK